MKREYKIVLGILKAFGGKLSRKSMQKLVFLFCERTNSSLFTFIPFRYGCFSEELAVLQPDFIKNRYLENNEFWQITKKGEKLSDDLDLIDATNIENLKKRFGNLTESDLIKYVYIAYPYYAINSIILGSVLSPAEQRPILLLKKKMSTIKGTPYYIAPEVIKEVYDEKCDI